jgi:hypothetical protein
MGVLRAMKITPLTDESPPTARDGSGFQPA